MSTIGRLWALPFGALLGSCGATAIALACAALQPPTRADQVRAVQLACAAVPADAPTEVLGACAVIRAVDPTKLPTDDDKRQIPADAAAGGARG